MDRLAGIRIKMELCISVIRVVGRHGAHKNQDQLPLYPEHQQVVCMIFNRFVTLFTKFAVSFNQICGSGVCKILKYPGKKKNIDVSLNKVCGIVKPNLLYCSQNLAIDSRRKKIFITSNNTRWQKPF